MKAFQLIHASVLSAVLMLSAGPAFSAGRGSFPEARFGTAGQQHVRHDGWRNDTGSRHDRRDDRWHWNDRRNDHDGNRWSDHGSRHDHRGELRNDHRRDYGPGYYPGQRYMFPLYDGRPNNRHDDRRGYYPGYRHRYYNGYHYYYNSSGFFFPGYGFIAYGHRHSSHCPHWHFEAFASGVILGAIISH